MRKTLRYITIYSLPLLFALMGCAASPLPGEPGTANRNALQTLNNSGGTSPSVSAGNSGFFPKNSTADIERVQDFCNAGSTSYDFNINPNSNSSAPQHALWVSFLGTPPTLGKAYALTNITRPDPNNTENLVTLPNGGKLIVAVPLSAAGVAGHGVGAFDTPIPLSGTVKVTRLGRIGQPAALTYHLKVLLEGGKRIVAVDGNIQASLRENDVMPPCAYAQ